MHDTEQREPKSGRIPFGSLVWLCTLAVAGATLLGYLGSLWWRLELLSHFRVQYALGAAVPLLAFAILRRWRGVAFAGLVAVPNLAAVLPLYADSTATAVRAGAQLRLLVANVHSRNTDYAAFLELIAAESPDVVLVMELDAGWLNALRGLDAGYPHRLTRDRPDNFGIGMWSRRPLLHAAIRDDLGPVPSIEARLRHDGATVDLVFTHPVPPVSRGNSATRDAQLRRVARLVRDRGPRTVLVGDFNTTPWAPIFAELLEIAELRHPGHGVQPTWPAALPWPLRIPIDHCLAKRGARVITQRLGPPIGSDHLPLIVDLAF